MIERRGRLRFAPESLECLVIFDQLIRKEFQRDKSPQLRIFSFINDTHSPTAKSLKYAVVGYRPSGKWRRIRHEREYYAGDSSKSTRRSIVVCRW
jgi:hypothetical protein